ncbi:TetR/AcrR family transcriptional regulator [Paractinoplanes ferrugineus]|uniref:Transcriptional regulatory protein TetR n=1 Tax=Paractinoplanes ferrugineus TaxID=113564 RepID=A0A919MDB2_9ACTN|nr:TetR/AcrR family transcriptional regulator [Actinoplanes ferrugineus]GIE08325.1 putative transcriptional regulatory protein TetR [Actinoplanes ferrugineus]
MSPRADAVRNRAKILEVAARVFAERGAAASTEQVAAEAGVAIGTVFRHFPTKADLLAAIMKDTLAALATRAAAPQATLAGVFTDLVASAADRRSVIDLLPGLEVAEALAQFRAVVADLLTRAQAAGEVRASIGVDEVMALLVALCQGALRGGWSPTLQRDTLAIVLDGLSYPGRSMAEAEG